MTPGKTTVQDNGKPTTLFNLGLRRAPVISRHPRIPRAGRWDSLPETVVRIDGHDIFTWSQMTALVRENPNHALQFEIQRNGSAQTVSVTPMGEKAAVDGKPAEIGKIGISAPEPDYFQTNEP